MKYKTLGSRTDIQTAYVFVEGHVGRAVKHHGSEGANPSCIFGCAPKPQWGRGGLEAQPHMLSSLGWSSQRFLVLGVAWKVGTGGSCSTLGTVINYQLIWCFLTDSCTTAGRNFDFQFYKQKWEVGTHLINLPMTAGYLTPQRTLEITVLVQLSEKQKSSQSSQVQILLKQMPAPRFPRFCFGMLCLPVSETQDTQVFMHFKGGSWLNLGKVCELEEGEEALGGTAAVVCRWVLEHSSRRAGSMALCKADSTDVLQLSLGLI